MLLREPFTRSEVLWANFARKIKVTTMTNGSNRARKMRPISLRVPLRVQPWQENSAADFGPIIRNKKGLAAIHVLVMTLFLVGIIIVFIAMVQNANIKEFKVLRENVNIIYTEGFGTLLRASLETSWRTIATQVLFSALDERFGLPEYFYNYSADITAMPDLAVVASDGCSSDKRLCLLTTAYATAKLTELISSVELPSSFEVFMRTGRGLLEYDRNVALTSAEQMLSIAQDRVHGRINQSISTTEPAATGTSIHANYTFLPEIDTQLWRLVNAVQPAVSIATRLRTRTSELQYAETTGRTIKALQNLFESDFEAVRDVAGSVKARYRLLPEWSSNGNALRLGYDATVVLADDSPSIASGLVGGAECSHVRTDMYNKYAGAIERSQPDRLLQYVEEPRALLAALAEELGHWDPLGATVDEGGSHNGLFGVLDGRLEPHKNAEQAVAALLRALESNDALHDALVIYLNVSDDRSWNVINTYESWKPCIAISQSPVFAQPNNPNRIFGPEDYARLLTTDMQTVRVGDDFCSASDYPLRGYRKLAYDFYSDSTSWQVRAAYPGTVVKVDPSDSRVEGCGGAVWIRTGNFMLAYMHISPSASINEGDDVTAGRLIGTVRSFVRQVCPYPKLTVLVSSWDATAPAAGSAEDTNACGVRTQCSGFGSAGTEMYLPNADAKYKHCGALEWDALFREQSENSGRLWRLLESRNEWTTAPLTMSFKMTDSFTALACAADGRYRWQSSSDLLCYNNTLWSCVNEIAGAKPATAGTMLGKYTCAERRYVTTDDEVSPQRVPLFKFFDESTRIAYESFIRGKRLTKWCANDELNRDWACCTGSGKQLSCPQNDYIVDGDALLCRGGVGEGGGSCA